jgi:hypothetical protein
MEHLSLEQLNHIDLVDFLASTGIQPKKRKAGNYFYLSPLAGHPEHQPTFVVNHRLNSWREITTHESGNFADLVVRLYDCTIGELTTILHAALLPVSHHGSTDGPVKIHPVTVEQTHPIRSNHLERFVWTRRIPLTVARHYCGEALYNCSNNHYHALAFANDEGGFELFDSRRHYRIPPNGPTHIRNQSDTIIIVRHVFDLLSYVTLLSGPVPRLPDFLALNAPLTFPTVRQIIAPYRYKQLILPNDAAGIAFSTLAIQTLHNCCDHRSLYAGYPTLNDWICHIGTSMKPKIPVSQPNQPQCPLNPSVPEKAPKWPLPGSLAR